MSNKLYVGNLPYSLNEDDLKQIFDQIASVVSVKIMTDKFTGKPKGFGFVEMQNAEDASKCVTELNGREIDGRAIKVDIAQPRPERPKGGGGGYGGGGGGGGRGRGGGGGGGGYGGGGGGRRDRY